MARPKFPPEANQDYGKAFSTAYGIAQGREGSDHLG
jgi:hypothetical protein